MKIEYRKQIDSETAPWQLLTNVDELIWNGVYALRVSHDNGSQNLPFCFGSDETATLAVKDHSHEGMLESARTIVQTITRVERSYGKVYTYTRTRYNDGGGHAWSQWIAVSEIPIASNTTIGGVIIGD